MTDHKVLYVDCERMPEFTSARNSLGLKMFSINILKCIYVLQFWWKLNIELLKPLHFVFCVIIIVILSMLCFSSFLAISYYMFPLVFLWSPWVLLRFPLSFSPISYFIFCGFNSCLLLDFLYLLEIWVFTSATFFK